MPVDQIYTTSWQMCGNYLMCRLRGNDGVLVTQASIQTIDCHVYEMLADDAQADEVLPAPIVSTVASLFDILQTPALDPRWTRDQVGYNFSFMLPAANIPLGNREYVAQFTYTPFVGDPFYFSAQISTSRIFAYPA